MEKEPDNIIELPKSKDYLPEDLHLPPGRIMKQYTGIGATTQEIKDSTRNSIIVVPTKALAATKVIYANNNLDSEKYIFLYGGSNYIGVQKTFLEEIYDAVHSKKIVKLICVADTFVNLFHKDESFFHRHFHLMLDEADSYQSESNYREVMEDCMDIYFRFNKANRRMVSATIQDSLWVKLRHEQLHLFKKDIPKKPSIRIIEEKGNLASAAVAIIKGILEKNRNIKLLVAVNSFDLIADIIYGLTKKHKEKIAVLCSENRKSTPLIAEYYRDLVDCKLPGKVNLVTSAYFSGIDIYEKANVLIVADPQMITTTLSPAKIFQISGRPRKGYTNLTLLMKTKFYERDPITEALNDKAEAKLRKKEVEKFIKQQESIGVKITDKIVNDFIKEQQKKPVRYYSNSLIRYRDGEVLINNMYIDYLYHYYKALNDLYSSLECAKKSLAKYFTISPDSATHNTPDLQLRERRLNKLKEVQGKKARKLLSKWRNEPPALITYGYSENPANEEALDEFQSIMKAILSLGFKNPEYTMICNWLLKEIKLYNPKRLKRIYERLRILLCLHKIEKTVDFRQFIPFEKWINLSDAPILLTEISEIDGFKYKIEVPVGDNPKAIKKELKKIFNLKTKTAGDEYFKVLGTLKVEDLLKQES